VPRSFVVEDVTVVGPQEVLEHASVRVEDGVIADVRPGATRAVGEVVDGRGRLLLPGFVDLHSDAIEKEIEPRPRTLFPIEFAIHELDKRLAACGVTTTYHSISFADGEIGTRSNTLAARIVTEVAARAPALRVRTRVHARFEITDQRAVPVLAELIDRGDVQLLSLMDHTPGQGQFREVTSFKAYYGTVYGKSDAELDGIIESKLRSRAESAPRSVGILLAHAKGQGIPIASHDVDSAEKVRWLEEQGVRITEFPVTLETARAATAAGIHVMLGAPNVFRGRSQAGNLSAREAIARGDGDILCSDYAPQAMLHAALLLARTGAMPLPAAVNLVSLHPARAVGLEDRIGSIEPGKEADLVLVDPAGEHPHVLRTFVGGRSVFATSARAA
jgi:alpha-D-ribose 1-methylphosphonate 5-triphosphate diphosphatase